MTTLLPFFDVPAWVELALCAQTDPEAFFPDKGGSSREAKAICARCEVRAECLAYALDNDERFGIWGGVTERERRALKKQATTTEKDTTMTIPVDEVPDFEVCESCFGSFAPTEVDKEGLCDSCAIAPAPPKAVKLVGRPPLPGWAVDAAELLVATEGHQDVLVRDVRKIAAQSLMALHLAKQQYDRLQASTERAIAAVKTESTKPTKKTAKRDPLATTVLMQREGITPAEVRAWAKEHGIDVADRGNPSLSVIRQYLEGLPATKQA